MGVAVGVVLIVGVASIVAVGVALQVGVALFPACPSLLMK